MPVLPLAQPHIQRALTLLAPTPDDRLLEIGCGHGKATLSLAMGGAFAHLLALDRSPSAIAAARAALQQAGLAPAARAKVTFRLGQLAGFNPGADRFDRIFAINVNLFWLDATRELPVLRQALARNGRLLLFYRPPIAGKIRRMVEGVRANLDGAGFVLEDVLQEGGQQAPFLALAAHSR